MFFIAAPWIQWISLCWTFIQAFAFVDCAIISSIFVALSCAFLTNCAKKKKDKPTVRIASLDDHSSRKRPPRTKRRRKHTSHVSETTNQTTTPEEKGKNDAPPKAKMDKADQSRRFGDHSLNAQTDLRSVHFNRLNNAAMQENRSQRLIGGGKNESGYAMPLPQGEPF